MEEGEVTQEGVTGVRRPMNAFLIFCKRHRSLVRQKNPHLDNRSVTRVLGELWANLPGEEKSSYTTLAKQYKEAFLKANPDYKWYNPEKVSSPGSNKPSTRPTNSMTTYHGHKPHLQGSATSPILKIPGAVGGLNLLLAAGQHALQATDAHGQIITIPQGQGHIQGQPALIQGQMPPVGMAPTTVTTTVPVTFHADTRDMVLNLSKSVVASLPLTSPVKLEAPKCETNLQPQMKIEANNNSDTIDSETPKPSGVFMFLPPGCVTSNVSLAGITSLTQTVIPSLPVSATLVSNSVATLATTDIATSTQHSTAIPASGPAEPLGSQFATMTVGNFIKQEITRATNEINPSQASAAQGTITLSQAIPQVSLAGNMSSWLLAQPPGVPPLAPPPTGDAENTDKNTALLELAQMCSSELSTTEPQTVPITAQPTLAVPTSVPVSHENFPLTPPWTPKYDSTFSPRHDCPPPDVNWQTSGWPTVGTAVTTTSNILPKPIEKDSIPTKPNVHVRPLEVQSSKAAVKITEKKASRDPVSTVSQIKTENNSVPQVCPPINMPAQPKKSDVSRSAVGAKKPLLEKAEVSKLVVERVIESMYSLEFGKPRIAETEPREVKVNRSLIGGSVRSAAARKEMPASVMSPAGRPSDLTVPPSGVSGGNGRSKTGLTFGQIQETLIRKAVADAYDFDLEEEKLKQEKEINPKLTPIKRDKDGSPRGSRNGSPNEDKPKSKVISLMGVKTTKLDFHQPEVPKVLSPIQLQTSLTQSGSRSPAKIDSSSANFVTPGSANIVSAACVETKQDVKMEGEVGLPTDSLPVTKKKRKRGIKNKEGKDEKKVKKSDSPKKVDKVTTKVGKKKVKKEGEKKKIRKKENKDESKESKDSVFHEPSPEHMHVDHEGLEEQGDTEDEGNMNMRKSKRSNRGKRYQQLIEEGFLQPARDKPGAKKLENCLPVDKQIFSCRKRTVSETSDAGSTPKKFKTGDFDLEAHIASLPACHIDGVDKKNVRQRLHKVRHHSESSLSSRSLASSCTLNQLNVAELHQVLKQQPTISTSDTQQVAAPLVGSKKRKARKVSICHLHPVHVFPSQEEEKHLTGLQPSDSTCCPKSAPPIPSLSACVSLAALADVAGNKAGSESAVVDPQPLISCPVTVSC